MNILTSTKFSAKSSAMSKQEKTSVKVADEIPVDDVSSFEVDEDSEDPSDYVLTKMIVSVSDFKKNPNKYVARLYKEGSEGAFAVITNNKTSFYVLTPEFFDQLDDIKWQHDNYEMLKERIAQAEKDIAEGKTIKVDIKDLLNDDVFAGVPEAGDK